MDMVTAPTGMNAAHERADKIVRMLLTIAPKLTRALPSVWEEQVLAVLKELGLTLEAWRVYAVKLLQPLGDSPYGFLRYEWKQTGEQYIFTQETAPMQELEMLGMSPWLVHLRRGDVVCTRRGEGIAQDGLWNVSPQMQTLMLLPVLIDNEWWGYLGIEDTSSRMFSGEEVKALKALTELLSAAIWRKRIDQQLLNIQLGTDRSPDIIFMTNRLGGFTYINEAFSLTYGYHFEEVVGQTPRILKSGHHTRDFYDAFWEKIKRGEAFTTEMVNKSKQGRQMAVVLSVSPVVNEYKKITGYLAVERVA